MTDGAVQTFDGILWLPVTMRQERTLRIGAENAKGDRYLRARRSLRKRGVLKGKRGSSHAQQPVMTATAHG
ncbi:MAG: hypothetical protein OXG05_06850 [Gammaproteobacteria bacterium]|nr:hypothetical protein [Gammaproteobacteria bacterium]